jgi:hypothetical protein
LEATVFYELRKYEVMPGKLPNLLDRFGSFVVKKWPAHGINLVGFWTPQFGGVNNQITYIWGWESLDQRMEILPAWQADPERARVFAETEKDGRLVRRVANLVMLPTAFCQIERGVAYGPDASTRQPYLFELREYDAIPGKLAALVDRFGSFTTNCFAKYGFRQVGFWTPRLGGHDHQLIYMLAWESHEERARCFAEFREDADRRRVFAQSEKDGPLVERVTNAMLEPASFSPIR